MSDFTAEKIENLTQEEYDAMTDDEYEALPEDLKGKLAERVQTGSLKEEFSSAVEGADSDAGEEF